MMRSGSIRLLRIMAYAIWIMSTLMGTLMFYNLTKIQTIWDTPTSVEGQLVINVDIRYNGYVFWLKFYIEIKLYDENEGVIAQDNETIYLAPGEKKSISLILNVSDKTYSYGEIIMRVDQVIGYIDMIGLVLRYNI